MQKKLLILAITIFFPLFVFGQDNPDSFFQKLSNKYKDMTSVSLNFSLSENSYFKGTITSKKNNNYIITTQGRTIVCNGKIVWNYTEAEKKVVISSYEGTTEDALSIESFFFSFLKDYRPITLSKETNSSNGSTIILTLEPKDNSNKIQGVNQIKIWANSSSLSIKKVQIITSSETQTWNISNLKINPNLTAKSFDFSPPKDTEIIDLR
jgi:outer membrane lipoprotein carrier protein